MSPSLRRRAQPPTIPSSEEPFSSSEDEYAEATFEEGDEPIPDPEDLDEDSEPLDMPPFPPSTAPPPHYRDISTLASWTASSSKPGCSIPQLRHPSTSLFWQSDGPQPHYLNIHFFKLVRIVGLRLYLDFEADESYTPTRIVLLAGSGMNDLVEWGEMRLESPRGWVWADFEGVGEGDSGDSGSEDDEDEEEGDAGRGYAGQSVHGGLGLPMPPPVHTNDTSDSENAAPPNPTQTTTPGPTTLTPDPMHLDPPPNAHQTPIPHLTATNTPTLPFPITRPHPRNPFAPLSPNTSPNPLSHTRTRKPKTPVLRCHLVQIKILENHQNGKDTHLRGLQIFARDNEREGRKAMVSVGMGGRNGDGKGEDSGAVGGGGKERRRMGGLTRSEWMGEASIR